jgi:iron complex transport system substrate-binding protein
MRFKSIRLLISVLILIILLPHCTGNEVTRRESNDIISTVVDSKEFLEPIQLPTEIPHVSKNDVSSTLKKDPEIHLSSNKELSYNPVTIYDRYGEPIMFKSPPERIVMFDAAAVEILFAIGQGERIIATHEYVTYPPESISIAKVGDAFNMNIEAIIGLNPDLVYIFYPTFKKRLEDAGLKVLLLETLDNDLNQMSDHYLMWGNITGATDAATKLSHSTTNRIKHIETILDPYESGPSVFQDIGGLWSPGNNTLIGSVFKLLKLDNISKSVDGYSQINPETILEKNPAYIFTETPGIFTQSSSFENVLAVRNNNIFTLNSEYLSISGPRFILGIEELAQIIYPGLIVVE